MVLIPGAGQLDQATVIEHKLQWLLFNCVDVLITGGLLAGGSEGIHKIMSLILGIVEKKKKALNPP